jgi:hypothetical protein
MEKKAAIEMSMTTFVTIVLVVIVMVLGIFFIQKIFKSGTNAIDTIDSQVQSELQKLFASEGAKTAFYPTSRELVIQKGDTPKGFAFQIKNNAVGDATYSYVTTATDVSKCGTFSIEDANNMLLGGTGSITVGTGDTSEARLVKFVVPDSAPPCTMEFDMKVSTTTGTYSDINFFLTIK